jgi:4-hydroxy-tetrahydrodipicolinate synthase
VKEAGGCVDRVSAIKNVSDIAVLSGDDALLVPMMSVGAVGVISVASNIIPEKVKALVDACLENDFVSAREMHHSLYSLFRDMFIETNPIPIKAAMAYKEMLKEEYRLPLTPIGCDNLNKLLDSLKSVGL